MIASCFCYHKETIERDDEYKLGCGVNPDVLYALDIYLPYSITADAFAEQIE